MHLARLAKDGSGYPSFALDLLNAVNNYRKAFMDDKELLRRISCLETMVEVLQEEHSQRAWALEKMMQELAARSNVFYRTEVALLARHPERAAIAKELRLSTQSELDDKALHADLIPHYEGVMLVALNSMLCAAGEPPRL